MRAPSSLPAKATQHGAALMVMLVILVMGAMTFLVSSLSTTAQKTARQEKTVEALAQAKEALIGYVASDTVRPGELPCPDIDNDGQVIMNVDFSGSNCTSLLGRLPWKTLGLPDLRDSAGERLWYAVSDPFHANSTAVLNSNTAGTLTVSGNISSNNVIAIVFAPGQPLPANDRTTTNINNYSYSLESVVTAPTSFNLMTPDDQPGGNHTYNDQSMLIMHDDLFPSAEKIVGNEIKKILNTYYAAWGTYPFAAPFADPSNPLNYTGQASSTRFDGLLPIGNNVTPTWAAIPNVTLDGTSCNTGTTPSCTCTLRPTGCATNCTYWRCNFGIGITGTPTIRIVGTLMGVGLGLWRPYDPNAGSSTSREVGVRIFGKSYPIGTYDAASMVMNNTAVSGVLNTDGSATVTFTGKVQSGNIPSRIQLLTTGIPFYTTPTVSPVIPSWFLDNNWHHVMYYATSPGYAPGGGNTCNPLPGASPSCLKLNNSDNNQAVIIMTGSALTGQTHPQSSIAHYLEGENATPADFIFENKTRSSTFNDQVIVVAP